MHAVSISRQRICVVLALVIVCVLYGDLAWGDGVIIIEPIRRPHPMPRPERPLEMLKQKADARIRDLAAVTTVEQTFHNPNSWDVEGTYLFPVPDGFQIDDFAMTVNGKQMSGELLDADKAREIYQQIVSRKKDPALLEFVGQRVYRARVYPIPANGQVDITIKFSGQLQPMAGLVTYRYPLKPDKSLGVIRDFELNADIQTTSPLSTVLCPTHDAKVHMAGEKSATVTYSAKDLDPAQDLLVYYRLSDEQFGLSLMTHKSGREDGFFMAWISPKRMEKAEALPKDIVFVIDTSGSMAEAGGKKLKQAKDALDFCLQNLNKNDRFNIISFSTDVRQFADDMRKVSNERLNDAQDYVEGLKATGGTDINGALKAALKMQPKDSDRPYMVVFLTDGMPTVGTIDTAEILRNVKKEAGQSVRLFVLGVGYDVNTALLDKLAEDNRGTRIYVEPKEDLEVKVSAFYKQIASPVLTDLALKVEGVRVYDLYPKDLPDLFAGSEVVVVGRYSEAGQAKFMLSGRQGEERSVYSYKRDFPERERQNDFLPRLWAMRKVGYLLDQIRLNGQKDELKKEVVELANRYGIVTPYTSYLVLEDEKMLRPDGSAERMQGRPYSGDALGRIVARSAPAREQAFSAGRAAEAPAAGGQGGVEISKSAGAMRYLSNMQGADRYAMSVAPPTPATTGAAASQPYSAPASAIQYVAGRAFYWQDGKWIDCLYDGKKDMKKVPAFSDEYFGLLRQHADLKSVLALGERVVFVLDGQAYEITELLTK